MICEYAKFFRVFLFQPSRTSAIIPSSRALAERMTEGLDLKNANVVVELGAGTGAFTRAILKQVRPEATVLVMEIDPLFASHLAGKFTRVHVANDSAERLDEHLKRLGHESADCVVSGLPWAGFPDEEQHRILSAVYRVLRPGGHLVTYAYNHMIRSRGGRQFRQLLESHFSSVTRSRTVWTNLPPAFVYRCQKKADS